jgi:hypothetical protein
VALGVFFHFTTSADFRVLLNFGDFQILFFHQRRAGIQFRHGRLATQLQCRGAALQPPSVLPIATPVMRFHVSIPKSKIETRVLSRSARSIQSRSRTPCRP